MLPLRLFYRLGIYQQMPEYSRLKEHFLRRALQLAVDRRRPRLAARILAWSCEPGGGQPGGARILVLNANKDGIAADAEESLASEFSIVRWPAHVVKICARSFLGAALDDVNLYLRADAETHRLRRRLQEFFVATWKYFQEIAPVDAAITANFGFRWEQEFAAALEASGTPFIVIQKENLNGITRPRWAYWETIYKRRGRFSGRKILTYNDVERQLEIASGVASPDRIVVTGMPRLDRMHSWRREHASEEAGPQNSVVFFSFDRRDKIAPGPEYSHLSWGAFCKDTHAAVLALARSHPELRVVIKTKSQTQQYADFTKLIAELGPVPANVEILTGGDPVDLIKNARVVVGFNTTANLEALAAGKPVIVPRFGEALNETLQAFILNLGNAVEYAESPQDLIARIEGRLASPATILGELNQEVSEILRKWVGNEDGAAGPRVLAAVRDEIARKAWRPPPTYVSDGNRHQTAAT